MFVPTQVKSKSQTEPESELCKFLREQFRREQEDAMVGKCSYEPHRYIIDVVHCEPPRILLGSLEDDKTLNLFKPDPIIVEALSAKQSEASQLVPNTAKPLFQNLPTMKPVAKKTFLDEVDDEQSLVKLEPKVKDISESLFKVENDQSDQGGLFGFTMDLPKLSRVGAVDEEDSAIKFDDELENEADDLEAEQERPSSKRQKTHEQSKRLDKEVDSFMKRKFEQ